MGDKTFLQATVINNIQVNAAKTTDFSILDMKE
jgi:hypothetical protein